MTGFARLLLHSLKRARTLLVAMAVLLAGFQALLISYANSIRISNTFDQMSATVPPFLRELMGPSFATMMSFRGIVCVGYFHPVVMGSLIALTIALATTPAAEIESGFMDLILARPLARHWIVTRTIVLTALCASLLLGAMMCGTWIGLKMLVPSDAGWPSSDLIRSLAINLGLLMLCWSGIAMAIGCASKRRGVAGGLTGMLALTTFLLDYLGRVWKPLEQAARVSPFRYYAPFDLLLGRRLPTGDLLMLASFAAVGFALAYVFFSRRDISH